MTGRLVQPIVEGHGEVESIPVLIRRTMYALGVYDIGVRKPMRWPVGKLVAEKGFKAAVNLAARQLGCGAIVVVFDADDACPKDLAPRLVAWAREVTHVPCGVVLAKREIEAWVLAGLDSLRGVRGISLEAEPPPRSGVDPRREGPPEGLDSGQQPLR